MACPDVWAKQACGKGESEMSKRHIRQSHADRIYDAIVLFLIILFLLIVLYPLWFVIIASFSNSSDVTNGSVIFLPKGFSLEAYEKVLSDPKIMTGYRNTIFYTVAGTLLNLAGTVAIAYPLSRKDFVGRKTISVILTFTMFFNGGLIPTYLIYKQLGLINTVWVMLIPGMVNVYNMIVMRSFFEGLPYEMHEAAFIDGCGNLQILLRIVLPLSLPILAVMVIFYGVTHWNEYFNALVYISAQELKPLQLILRDILITNTTRVSSMMSGGAATTGEMDRIRTAESIKYAVAIVSTLPVLCLYPVLQKHFSKGVMIGAIKG